MLKEYSSSPKIRPKKSLSQIFLVNLHAAERIVDSLNLSPDASVLEIGAGKGVLTQFLIEQAKKVYAVELDKSLYEFLREKFSNQKNLEIINQDILQLDLKKLLPSSPKIKIIGNLPYQITSPILDWLIQYKELISQAVLMVQKEVAIRMSASPGGKDFSPLSIFVQVYTKPKILFSLKPGSFNPPPKIESTVIVLDFLSQSRVKPEDEKLFFQIVKASFSTRRKTILNCLSSNLKLPKNLVEKILAEQKINPQSRAETLEINQYLKLTQELKNYQDYF
ncbi:MAG: dimethyladenosine transferase [candidate division Zixibacteria bacterium RBG-1]|nr:MAG: dimethyladenosine transferase [candidate division Zixibacteria bacterium RBG-1]OGC83148.1 MAG: ribosomal RNA small subunit methyltransferase A [candidate division Zixibacteria bacterium RBG_19FT_COMBO_42_43]